MSPIAIRVARALALAVLMLAHVLLAGPTSAEPKSYTTAGTETPPRIDGRIDDVCWDAVEWSGGFIQREPTEGAAPTADTRFKILYDESNLYLAYQAFDPEPDKIASILGRRDNFPGDWVEVNIDSYHDHRTAFSFTASVSGTQGDEFVSEDGDRWDGNWDPVWEHETRIDDEGWTAEVRIPMSQLRYGEKEEHVWGIQVQRRIHRKEERSVWQTIPKDERGWVSKFGELHGIRGIKAQRQIEILPYTLAQSERFAEVSGDPFADGSEAKLSGGLDGKFGIASNLTVDLTVNPDFGQVEADPSQVNLTAFETFFDEKRPFFIEGANIFEFRLAPSIAFGTHTRDRIFYSRRIGRSPQYSADVDDAYVDQPENTSILGAVKLTGKTQRGLSIGLLESVTARERAKVDLGGDRHKVTVEPLSNYLVGRLQRDFRKGDTRLGALLTSVNRRIDEEQLEFLHSSAYAGAVDFFHYLGERKYYVAVNLAGSRVAGTEEAVLRTQTAPARYYQRPDNAHQSLDSTRTSLSGHAGSLRLGKSSGRLSFEAGGAWRSPGFEINDLGFLRNADEINEFSWIGYSFRNPVAIFRSMGLNFNQWLDFQYGGENLYQAFNFNTHATFKNNWSYNASCTRENTRISNNELRGGPSIKLPGNVYAEAGFDSDSRRLLSGGLGGAFTHYDDGSGRSRNVWTYLAWRPTNAMRAQVTPSYSHYEPELQFVESVDSGEDTAYLYGSLDQKTFDLSLRLDYSVTPDLTIQYYGAPFISAGRYGDFKRITSPRAYRYERRFRSLAGEVAYDEANETYLVDEAGDGATDYEFGNPDFNVRDFNSNLVIRWQYTPGSRIFLVWSQSRSGFDPSGHFSIRNDLDSLFDVHPHDVFLIKIDRWINL